MALVLSVMASSMRASSISNVSGLGSTRTGLSPFSVMARRVAM